MAWENRGNRQYYYRKRRIGGQVVSEYYGYSDFALMLAEMDELEREQREAERQLIQEERAEVKKIDDQLNNYGDMVRTLIRAVMLASGYHPHKGQWRKNRDERTRFKNQD